MPYLFLGEDDIQTLSDDLEAPSTVVGRGHRQDVPALERFR